MRSAVLDTRLKLSNAPARHEVCMDLTVYVFGWLWVALLGAIVGGSRGQAGTGFFVTLLWGPIGLVGAATLPMTLAEATRREKVLAQAREAADLELRAARARSNAGGQGA
jgi:hypothetical protein